MRIRMKIHNTNWRVRKSAILLFFCFIPFFQPGCIDSFIAYNINSAIYEVVRFLFNSSKLAISVIVVTLTIVKMMNNRRERNKKTVLFPYFFISSCLVIVSNVYNHFGIGSVFVGIYEIGFLCLCELAVEKGDGLFLKVLMAFFGVYSIIGACSAFIFPNGFNHAADIHYAIFFLGSKNASVNAYLLFLMVYSGVFYLRNNILPVGSFLYALLFLLSGFVMQSSSTIISLGLLILFYIVYGVLKRERFIRPWISFVVVILGLLFIYFGSASPRIVHLLSYLGRDITYSGRTILWKQAIDYFHASPILGGGSRITFSNFSGTIQYGAHSQYFDRLAKYGIISFAGMIAAMVMTERLLITSENKKLTSLIGVIFSVFLFRIGFDSYNFAYIIVICYSILSLVNKSEQEFGLRNNRKSYHFRRIRGNLR